MQTAEQFEQTLDGTEWSDVSLVLLASLGPGASWPAAIRKRTKAPILAYEPREDVCSDCDDVDHCAVTTSIINFRSVARDISDEIFGGKVAVFYDDESPKLYDEMKRAWEEVDLTGAQRGYSDAVFSGFRVAALLESIDLLVKYPPINHLEDSFDGIPAIIVGAGPSLDSQIDALKQHRGLIIAVNSSWPALHKAGITPDLVVICEAKPVGKTISHLPVGDVVMVPGMHVGRDTWALPWKRIAPAISLEGAFGPWVTSMFGVRPAAIGGSSACLGVGIAVLLGCDRIVLVGCDCAFPDGKMYSDHSAFAGTQVRHDGDAIHVIKSDAKLSVEDLRQGSLEVRETTDSTVETDSWDLSHKVLTIPVYDGLRQWFEEAADAWAASGRRFINASVGGAHIYNWEHLTAAEALDGLPVLDSFAPMIGSALKQLEGRGTIDLDAALDVQIEGAETIGEYAKEGVRVTRDLIDAWREISEAGVEIEGANQKTWHRLEREHVDDDYVPAFEFLARALEAAADKHPRCVEAANLCREARKIQTDVGALKGGSELIDAFVYGPVDVCRHRGDRPAAEVFNEIFVEIERGSAELVPLIREVKQRINA